MSDEDLEDVLYTQDEIRSVMGSIDLQKYREQSKVIYEDPSLSLGMRISVFGKKIVEWGEELHHQGARLGTTPESDRLKMLRALLELDLVLNGINKVATIIKQDAYDASSPHAQTVIER